MPSPKRPGSSGGARKKKGPKAAGPAAQSYKHPEASSPLRPEVGTQAQFKKKKPPVTYRYDSSLSPALDWDGRNPGRDSGDELVRKILEAESLEQAKAAAGELKALGEPFLNWSGKAERLSFDVPTLPLFVHERLSTKAILETLKRHKKDQQEDMFDLFGDPQHSIADQVLRAYEYQDQWVNRMILGDSLVVMNSLLHYEGLGGQVQMIYLDPPYGVEFGSNFQPFVRRRSVEHNDDDEMTREPEMVQAYRDTWVLGLHSYLSYLRDRLLLARDLLTASGSVFVQISDENVHHVREILDEVFGPENAVVTIVLKKKGATAVAQPVNDFLLWYARDRTRLKARAIFEKRKRPEDDPKFNTLLSPDGDPVRITDLEDEDVEELIAKGYEFARVNYPLVSQDPSPTRSGEFEWNGKLYSCGKNKHWRFDPQTQMKVLAGAGRLFDGGGKSLGGVIRWSDWPYVYLTNIWSDLHGEQDPIYVVQTNRKAVARCLLMTTDPGDLVLDPTCGSGTTAFVAEQWGRRWITVDTSRVPLALARQRLLTATFPWYTLQDSARGPVGGFVYQRKKNKAGEEAGGVVPRITLRTIATGEPPEEEVLIDRPTAETGITRVTGPFCVEATIPTPVDWEGDGEEDGKARTPESYSTFVERMLEVLRRSPVLRLEGNKSVTLQGIRPPAKTLALSAEAMVHNGTAKPVAVLFGPENGAVSEKLVYEAAREAHAKNYTHLYVFGFAIQPNARELIEKSVDAMGVPATYVQATPDLLMGDLLKNMRSSQIFSVCGLPEIELKRLKAKTKGEDDAYQVTLVGLDVFDPVSMEVDHQKGEDVPAWLLDSDYNDLCFRVTQAFFPRTGAWESLKKALKADYEASVWDHLAGTTSAPFEAGEHGKIAVKVIDSRGNELLVVRSLAEAVK
jgi:adenine-specific DNA-methyltransferase